MITSKKDLRYYIAEDYKMHEHRMKPSDSLENKLHNFLYKYFDKVLLFQRTLRRLEYYTNICRNNQWAIIQRIRYYLLYKKLSYKLGFTIPINVIGSGLFIAHYGTIIINHRATIGSNCILHACVNIGIHKGGTPKIGNNYDIGPGAKLFGAIEIGNNVTIGANSVVNKSFPDNVIIAGIPAKIIRYKNG
jgi:serine O-acetyltransferase